MKLDCSLQNYGNNDIEIKEYCKLNKVNLCLISRNKQSISVMRQILCF